MAGRDAAAESREKAHAQKKRSTGMDMAPIRSRARATQSLTTGGSGGPILATGTGFVSPGAISATGRTVAFRRMMFRTANAIPYTGIHRAGTSAFTSDEDRSATISGPAATPNASALTQNVLELKREMA